MALGAPGGRPVAVNDPFLWGPDAYDEDGVAWDDPFFWGPGTDDEDDEDDCDEDQIGRAHV